MSAADVFAAEWHNLAQALALPTALTNALLAELQAGYGDPARSDNERRSADRLKQRLSGFIPAGRLGRATATIEATATHRATGNHDIDLVLDLDMAILGQLWPVYEIYARGVMTEYLPHIGEAAWRHGWVALFIDPTLAHGDIFLTRYFKPLEAQAVENLRREKTWLTGELRD